MEDTSTEDEGHEGRGTLCQVICKPCFENGDYDRMYPGGSHDDEPVWGIAEIGAANADGDWDVTWLATGLTVAQAEAELDRSYGQFSRQLPL